MVSSHLLLGSECCLCKWLGSVQKTLQSAVCSKEGCFKSRKWYRRIFYWALNVVCVNGWVLYRRHCSQLSVPKKDDLDLLGFITRISQCLIMINKHAPPLQHKCGRPSVKASSASSENEQPVEKSLQKRAVQPTPLRRSGWMALLTCQNTSPSRAAVDSAKRQSFVPIAPNVVFFCV